MIADELDLGKPLIFELPAVFTAAECEYQPGHRFAPHSDGAFIRGDGERSWYTYMVYLNDGFAGGETLFFVEPEVIIRPRAGAALIFQHPIIHEGSEVTSGVKYVVRTDLMYRSSAS